MGTVNIFQSIIDVRRTNLARRFPDDGEESVTPRGRQSGASSGAISSQLSTGCQHFRRCSPFATVRIFLLPISDLSRENDTVGNRRVFHRMNVNENNQKSTARVRERFKIKKGERYRPSFLFSREYIFGLTNASASMGRDLKR